MKCNVRVAVVISLVAWGGVSVSEAATTELLKDLLARRAAWIEKSEAAKPRLLTREVKPVGLVKIVSDASSFQSWRARPSHGDVVTLKTRLESCNVFPTTRG